MPRKARRAKSGRYAACKGGEAAGIARKAVEERTGVPVITSKNAAQLNQVVTDLLEGAAADMSEMPEEK